MRKDELVHYGTVYRLSPIDQKWKSATGQVLAPQHVTKVLAERAARAQKNAAKKEGAGVSQKPPRRGRGAPIVFSAQLPKNPRV
jgi:hypothetical protein